MLWNPLQSPPSGGPSGSIGAGRAVASFSGSGDGSDSMSLPGSQLPSSEDDESMLSEELPKDARGA